MKRLALITAALLTLTAAPAVAAPSPPSGTIELDQVESSDGGATATSAEASGPRFGDHVGFATTVSGKIASKARIYVLVLCRQDGSIVYQASADPDAMFALEDQAGQGLDWLGGAAECTGHLVYRVTKGKNTTISYLDTHDFHVAA